MTTLADLFVAIDEDSASPGWSVVSLSSKKEMLITLRRIAEMRDYPLELIDIDEMVGAAFHKELADYVIARGIYRQGVTRYGTMKDRLLSFAYASGWSGTADYVLHRSWDRARSALKGAGTSGIVDFAIRMGKAPSEFTQDDIAKWMQEMLDKKRSLGTVIATERCFRLQLRRAHLQNLFPRFSLASRNPTEYQLPLEQMSASLRKEIRAILRWKTRTERVRGRKSKFKIRPTTARRLQEVLTELCGYAVLKCGVRNLTTLRQVFRKEILNGFADWLLLERKCKPWSIRTALRTIRALTWQHPRFKGADYSWLARKIRQLPHEPKATRRQRQIDKMVPYELLAQVPCLIREERLRSPDWNPVEIARSIRDELFMAWPLHWRQINLREFNLRKNLKEGVLSRDIRRRMHMPKHLEAELKKNPYKAVVYSHHKEDSTKNKKEVFEVIAPDILPLLREYLDVHRGLLIGDNERAQAAHQERAILFVNNAGMPMCKQDVIGLVTRLSMRHLGRRLLPHSRRRVAASYALARGETIEAVQSMMWHSDPATTWLYADAASASSGVVALEEHYKSAQLKHEPGTHRKPTHNSPEAGLCLISWD